MNVRTVRIALWCAVGLAALGFGGLQVWRAFDPPKVATGLIPPTDQIGGPFALVDQDGKPVTEQSLRGTATAIFFGFTHCPDVCPTTLSEATTWLEALGPDAGKVRFVFVSVDPERDTPEVMQNYLSAFDGRITGLSGAPDAVERMIKAYKVFARKVPLKDGDYTMDHTAGIYLMNRDMKFVGLLNYQEDKDKAIAKLKALIAG